MNDTMLKQNLEQEMFPTKTIVRTNQAKRIDDEKTLSTGTGTSSSISTDTRSEICNETESAILRSHSSNNYNNSGHDKPATSTIQSMNTKTSMLDQQQIAAKLKQLPIDSNEFLIYASCFGTDLDSFILKSFCNNSSELLSYHCKLLASHGILVKCDIRNDTDCYWKFRDQSILQAAYEMIPPDERNTFHYKIGRKLWQQLTVIEIDQYIFVLVDQLLHGIDIIKQKEGVNENAAVAKLLLRAGQRCVQLSDFGKACQYLANGIALLDDHSWRNEYELCLNIYNAAAEVAYCSGDFNHANHLVEVTLLHSQLFEDKIQAYVTKIFSLGTSGKIDAAIETGIFVLSKLGEKLPIRQSKIRLMIEFVRIKRKLKSLSDDALLNLPLLQDSTIESVMKILNAMFSYAFGDSVLLGAFIGLRMLHLTMLYGQSAMSPLGFILYGTILCDWNIDEGFRFGRLGYHMFERQNVTQWTGRVYLLYFGLIHCLKMPVQETVVKLKYASVTAFQKGDIEYSFLCGIMYMYGQFELAPLNDLKTINVELRQHMERFHQEHSMAMTKSMETFLRYVRGEEEYDGTRSDPTTIDDNVFQYNNEIVMEITQPWTYFDLMMIDYLFGNIDRAYRQAKVLLGYIRKVPSPIMMNKQPMVLFYVGLVAIEYRRRYKSGGLRQAKYCWKRIRLFAMHAPCNVLSKQYLLEAELASLTPSNNSSGALVKYFSATAVAKESGLLTEIALSYERTAKFLLLRGEIERAEPFYKNAIFHYQEWGSEPKVTHLQKEIGYYFSSPTKSYQRK